MDFIKALVVVLSTKKSNLVIFHNEKVGNTSKTCRKTIESSNFFPLCGDFRFEIHYYNNDGESFADVEINDLRILAVALSEIFLLNKKM